MIFNRTLRAWSLLFLVTLLLGACNVAPSGTVPPPAATAASIAGVVAAHTPDPAPAFGEGGINAPEPSLQPQADPPSATAGPGVASTSAPTPAPPPSVTPAPTEAPTELPPTATPTDPADVWSKEPHPLQIAVMRKQAYPGSEISLEQTLAPGANYSRYVVAYRSEGYKIYALMTVPNGEKPPTGWPVILFNHGYIPPAQYRTTERYVAYVDAIARSGYIVFKSDYRGHGSSEGESASSYGSAAYTIDVLNALSSLKAYPDADPNRIGMWGHSMGGQITLRSMVVSNEIKAGVIWGGSVASYTDSYNGWGRRRTAATPSTSSNRRRWRQELAERYGTPDQNPAFWESISPNSFLADLSGPLQLHHSVTDETVPVAYSQRLAEQMQAAGRPAELFIYPGDNHNISANFNAAMQRSIEFFDKYVKG